MLKLRWYNDIAITKITTPLYFISGDKDTFVPTKMTEALHFKAIQSAYKEIFIVPGGEHNNTFVIAG
jgi:fermentation-respiration switch protein FrsA (DUF1100 family)